MRRIHDRVTGVDGETGSPYAASDPALLLWVHAALVDSNLAAREMFSTPLPADDADRYVEEMVVAAELLGVSAELVPDSRAALTRYIESVRPQLLCTPAARESMAYLLDPPGLSEELAEIWQDIRDAAVISLPDWAREMYGYPRTAADRDAPGGDPAGPGRAGRGVPRPARRAGGQAADHVADARRRARMRSLRRALLALSAGYRGDRVRRWRSCAAGSGGCGSSAALAAAGLAVRGGLRYAGSAPRLFAAAGENRERLRNDLAMQTADDVTATLGTMKGVMVKLGQMASYVDDGLAPSVRRTLSRLQDSVPPMSAELAAERHRGGARPAAGAGLQPVGSRADRGGVDRPGAPGHHHRRAGGRGEGAVPAASPR